jgi:diguanylate cyclase (GGDEF)-like protein/PAS domain S-box-containing protein
LRRVLLAYVAFAVVLTALQMAFELRAVRADIIGELESLSGAAVPGAESALWDLQIALLDTMVRGVGANPDVAQVEIRDESGRLLAQWKAAPDKPPAEDLAVERVLVRGAGPGQILLGSLSIRSSHAVLAARVQDVLASVAGVATALFFCLGALLWLLLRALVVRPLQALTAQVGARAASAGEGPIDLGAVSVSEIETLRQGFNRLLAQVAERNALLQREKTQIRDIIDVIPDLIFIKDRDGVYQGCNRAFEAFVGRPESRIVGCNDPDLFPAAVADIARRTDQESLRSAATVSYEVEVAAHDGRPACMETLKTALRGPNGRVQGIVGISRDITQRKALEEQHRLAALVYRNSSEALVATDEADRIIAVNPAFTELTGYSEAEVLGRGPEILGAGGADAGAFLRIWRSLETIDRWQGEVWSRHKDGRDIAVWATVNTVFSADGTLHRRVVLFSDITEKKKADQLIWTQANYDPLTGLPNRRLFQDRLEQEIRKAMREGQRVAVLFIDLDRFKEVNDSLGHEVGDRLLVEAASRIKRRLRDSDTLSRFGGDEFTVIQSDADDAAGIGRLSTEIIERLSEAFETEGQEVYVSASIGIALYPDDAATVSDLVKQADQAMYAAKSAGRGRYHFFTRSLQEASEFRIRLAGDLRRAIKEGQFEVHYQPVIDLRTGRIHKAEALLRWRHPALGSISPGTFIPIAEETGAIQEIGDWVFHEAIGQVRRWQARGAADFQVGVNMSPAQFLREPRARLRWIERLRELGLAGSSIIVEITEGLLMSDAAEVSEILLGFRDAGIQVAIDDFGTGYSALSYLKKFDIDYLKIDRSFTNNLAPASPDLALCQAIVVMAHKLDLKVIAEGVETQGQRELLQQIGCDSAQGFLFARPVPAEEFDRLLDRQAQGLLAAQGCQSE